MRCGTEELRALGELIDSGQAERLGAYMWLLWPPDSPWDREDVEVLTMLLRSNKRRFGDDRAHPIYLTYAERLKSHTDDFSWLLTLPLRSEIVELYEGPDLAVAWLEALRPRIMPPDVGIVDLLVGRILMEKGAFGDARRLLMSALEYSVQGTVEWYRLEALNGVCLCLAQLGEGRLAFEYARSYAIERFKLGRSTEDELYRMVNGLAMTFGQIDYLVEVKKNVASDAHAKGDLGKASEEESGAALRLAMIGVRDEAVAAMRRAASYAAESQSLNDRWFAVACALLARYLDETPLGDEEPEALWYEVSQVIDLPSGMDRAIFKDMWKTSSVAAPPDAVTLEAWLGLCARYRLPPFLSRHESTSLHLCNHLSALMGRYYAQGKDGRVAAELLKGVASIESREALYLFARQDYVHRLVREGRFPEALRICQQALAQDTPVIDERFLFARLAARCCLALGREQQAFAYAKLALSAWRRILEGLFAERHKAAWLSQGSDLIACAMEILAAPLSWMTEETRHREIFGLMEQGKARLMTDTVNHSGYIPGVYLLQGLFQKKNTDMLLTLAREYPEWYIPVLLQMPSYCDAITAVVHEADGRVREMKKIKLSALQSVVQLPLSPEQSLYATAQSLPFEESEEPGGEELYDDFIQVLLSSDEGSGGP